MYRMPPKKSRAKKPKTTVSQRQTAQQRQNINIRIGDLSTKKPRKKRAPRAPRAAIQPMVNLPPVVYQIPAMLTSYNLPPAPAPRTIADAMPKRTTIADPMPRATSIAGSFPDDTLSTFSSIAGSFPDDTLSTFSSEILERPDRSETLSQLGDLVSVESPDDSDMASLPQLLSTEEEDRMMRANIFASPQQSFGLLSPSEVSGNLRGSRGDPEDFFTEPVQPRSPVSAISEPDPEQARAYLDYKREMDRLAEQEDKKLTKREKRRMRDAIKRQQMAEQKREEAEAKKLERERRAAQVAAATAMPEVITEPAQVGKKGKGGRTAGRKNRSEEEKLQMEMAKADRKRLQAEAKARKNAEKAEAKARKDAEKAQEKKRIAEQKAQAKKTSGKMNKKLVKIEQQREELSIPPEL